MLRIHVNSRGARCWSDGDPITTGSVGYPVEFRFSADWDGLTKIAVFKGSGQAFDVPLINTDTTAIPHEVLTQSGKTLKIGVYGANGDGNIVIPTVYVNAGIILPGTEPSEVDPSIPTPSWAIQVQEAAAETLARANESADAAKASELAAESSEENARASELSASESAASAAQSESAAAQSASSAQQSAVSATSSASQAATSASDAYRDAERAEQAANNAGYMDMEINERGHLIYTRTDAVDVDFALVNGHLIMEAI